MTAALDSRHRSVAGRAGSRSRLQVMRRESTPRGCDLHRAWRVHAVVLAWHLGRRTVRDTGAFTEKLNAATAGNFQITTDGFAAYRDAVSLSLGTRVDFAQLIKVYASSQEETRYSPAEVVQRR